MTRNARDRYDLRVRKPLEEDLDNADASTDRGRSSPITNEWQNLAILWHGYFGLLAAALTLGFRPSRRRMAVVLAIPVLSVAAVAWVTRNPFNGTLFTASAIGLFVISRQLPSRPVCIGPWSSTFCGAVLVISGWGYPHFLETTSVVPYLYAAPTGMIPCPTLSIVIGMSLIIGGLQSPHWSLLVGTVGLFYGVFGAVRLGVTIDWILVAGALTILWMGNRHRS